jgi:hypothetical protein
VLELVLETKHMPQSLAQHGTVTVTAEEVAQRIGQVFIQRVRACRRVCMRVHILSLSARLSHQAAEDAWSSSHGLSSRCVDRIEGSGCWQSSRYKLTEVYLRGGPGVPGACLKAVHDGDALLCLPKCSVTHNHVRQNGLSCC